MKRRILLILFWLCCAVSYGQMSPRWTSELMRGETYPAASFFTGYAEGGLRTGESAEAAKKRLLKEAQGLLVESIRVKVESNTKSTSSSTKHNQRETLESALTAEVITAASAEVAGVKAESYYDKSENIVYAFAYVNKFELIGYYKANLNLQYQQAAGALRTAEQLEQSGEKAKARRQCEEALPLTAKIRSAQDLLTAIDNTANPEALKIAETEQMYNSLRQMQARLSQGVYVFVENSETLFGEKSDITANKLKAELAVKGCSFVENAEQADFRLRIKASTRESSANGGIVFCYADVVVELYDMHKQKNVYANEFSQKGGSSSKDKAGRKALGDASAKIAEELKKWIE